MGHLSFSLVLGIALLQIFSVLGTNCNWHLYKHYEQKGCRAIVGDDGCPVKFVCEELSDEDMRTCVHSGKIYKNRDHIESAGPCNSCSCMDDGGSAYIECASVDCPDWVPKNKSCYMGFKPHECCPVEMCPDVKEKSKTCKYAGKEYKIGNYIQTSNPCRSCICTEKWTDENGPGCSEVDCLNGIYARKIRSGCIPIYRENSCCFNEMYCDNIKGLTPVTPTEEDDRDDYCFYRGMYYEKGSTAFLETDMHQCAVCKCSIPPDFTCLKQTCPLKQRKL